MAVRIAGVVIPQDKQIETALTYIYGIGLKRSQTILKSAGIDPTIRTKDLSEEQSKKIRDFIKTNYKTEGDLRRDVSGNIKRLKDIKAYRGIRHERHLPVRGQRTKTNQRTVKGNVRTTLGSGRTKLAKT